MYYKMYYPPELYHYGVKGMKWGVRNDYVIHPKSKYEKKSKLTPNQKNALKIAAGVTLAAGGVALGVVGTKGISGFLKDPTDYKRALSSMKHGAIAVNNAMKKYGKMAIENIPSIPESIEIGKKIGKAAIDSRRALQSTDIGRKMVRGMDEIAIAAGVSTGYSMYKKHKDKRGE